MKQYTHIIWDFNGTVLDDMQAGIDSINAMLAPRGLPILKDLAAYREVFDFPVEEYYRRLGLDFQKESYHDVLAPMWVELYLKNSTNAPLFAGVAPLCAALRGAGLRQSILSASHEGMLREQLAARGAIDWFDEIWGTGTIHAAGKSELANVWRAAHPDDVALLLGDTTHDYEVARAMHADCILVAAGHHPRHKLERCGVPVVDSLEEVLPLLLPPL